DGRAEGGPGVEVLHEPQREVVGRLHPPGAPVGTGRPDDPPAAEPPQVHRGTDHRSHAVTAGLVPGRLLRGEVGQELPVGAGVPGGAHRVTAGASATSARARSCTSGGYAGVTPV